MFFLENWKTPKRLPGSMGINRRQMRTTCS